MSACAPWHKHVPRCLYTSQELGDLLYNDPLDISSGGDTKDSCIAQKSYETDSSECRNEGSVEEEGSMMWNTC